MERGSRMEGAGPYNASLGTGAAEYEKLPERTRAKKFRSPPSGRLGALMEHGSKIGGGPL